jgi:hypothetical protein
MKLKTMDFQATPISQLGAPTYDPTVPVGGSGDTSGGNLADDILRQMDIQQQGGQMEMATPIHREEESMPVEEGYENENEYGGEEYGEEMGEEQMQMYMENQTAMARQFVMYESVVLVVLFVLLQQTFLVEPIQKFLTKQLSKLSAKHISWVDMVVRGLILAVVFVLVREFVL